MKKQAPKDCPHCKGNMKEETNLCATHFKKLQTLWYAKIKKAGHDEAEDINSPQEFMKSHHDHRFRTKYDSTTFLAKQEYFRQAGLFLNEHEFKSNKEREIWRLHADGFSLRKIATALKKKRMKTNKDIVMKTVNELVELMKLGIEVDGEEDGTEQASTTTHDH